MSNGGHYDEVGTGNAIPDAVIGFIAGGDQFNSVGVTPDVRSD